MHIEVKKGLDIPIEGRPEGVIRQNIPAGTAHELTIPEEIALSYDAFSDLRLKLLAKPGERVLQGQPLAEDKATPGRHFVAPATGILKEEQRGAKRRLLAQVIQTERGADNHHFDHGKISEHCSREELVAYLLKGGAFSHIRQRPFDFLADPTKEPRSIFVKALESAPFVPPAELQIMGYEEEFAAGLKALCRLTRGPVHLVHRQDTHCNAFTNAQNVEKHSVSGPHPSANPSLHIQQIDPIVSVDDVVWTLSALDVVVIGSLLKNGRYHSDRIIAIAGPGILPEQVGYYRGRAGFPINGLIAGRIHKGAVRLISGDPLTGHQVASTGFIGFYHTVLSAIPENHHRQFLHFFRLGLDKYSFSRTYATGHLDNRDREYMFTTNQHGEHRAFIDPTLLEKVMPMRIPTMQLVKAVMAEDFDLAEEYGLLEVVPEDFALPAFVCPSKVEMVEIIENGLKQYAKEMMG